MFYSSKCFFHRLCDRYIFKFDTTKWCLLKERSQIVERNADPPHSWFFIGPWWHRLPLSFAFLRPMETPLPKFLWKAITRCSEGSKNNQPRSARLLLLAPQKFCHCRQKHSPFLPPHTFANFAHNHCCVYYWNSTYK